MEAKVREILAAVLKTDLDHVTPDANFFALGGYSLLALTAIGEINGHFGIAMPLTSLFECATFADLERRIALERSLAKPAPAESEDRGVELEEGVL